TLMAGLAAVTSKIKLFATSATLVMPPAIVARMASTIDSISHGRFGLNVITGWQRPEYSQMGMWPGDEFFQNRYEYLGEYVQVMRELWDKGQSDHKGRFFQMDDCRLSPRPQAPMKIICAGQSEAGLAFSAQYADYNFCLGKGVNTPTAFAPTVEKMAVAAARTGRDVQTFALMMVITADTDEEAMAKWKHYNDGADLEAIGWMARQAAADTRSGADTNVRQLAAPEGAVNLNFGTLVGSHATVARMLDAIAAMKGVAGVLLTFDEFVSGVTTFGEKIQPLMASRQPQAAMAEVA
ncbi:MAG: pyrimidine utilization protein A, partial [Parafilimonas terrae]|nr:pyrimidine utilization protein A [Parafilimonas terrae]